ncbi:stress response translation initiation inhibitor YciH [Sodalis-like symbiont of Philaenus spumarius]|nr:stress response translation initiation inhibitor YciH [Sodalis-like symbiont of Philaenus spumarius]
MSDTNRLVYSTDGGRIKANETSAARAPGNGIVRLQRQTSGRKGKGVCLIAGLEWDDAALQSLASELKKKCGTGGGRVKDGVIEIQGDKRDVLKQLLEARGLKVKLAGG